MRGNPEASHKTLKEHPPYVGKPGPPKRLKNGHRQTRKSPRPLKEKWKATAQGEFEERQKDLKKRAVRLIPDLRALLRAHEQALVLLSLLLPRARWAHGGSTTGIIHHVPAVTFAVLFASFARSFVTIFEATKLAQNLRRACVQPLNRNATALQHRSGNGRWETTARGVRALQGRADFFGRSSVVYQGGDQDLSCQCVCEFGNDCVAALASSYSGMTAWQRWPNGCCLPQQRVVLLARNRRGQLSMVKGGHASVTPWFPTRARRLPSLARPWRGVATG